MRKANALLVLTLGFWPVLSVWSRGDLTWTTKEITLHPALEDATAVAHYRFQNTGNQPVTVSQVTTSCGCTRAHADKSTYQPGDKGEITATLGVPIITGLEDKQIYVTTSEKNTPTTLDLKVYIPEVMKLTPAKLTWQPNEPMTAKTILVEMTAPQEMNVAQLFWVAAPFFSAAANTPVA